ncbi:hypothetical protein [Trinickia dinghuensis]|uniref:hypothetical protein n=1 Tax=Trinickia dinghuensis TaxID=2291023 RepID=UPI0011C01FD0|nr:hypothetical protein [Trinickia dinghuensis]
MATTHVGSSFNRFPVNEGRVACATAATREKIGTWLENQETTGSRGRPDRAIGGKTLPNVHSARPDLRLEKASNMNIRCDESDMDEMIEASKMLRAAGISHEDVAALGRSRHRIAAASYLPGSPSACDECGRLLSRYNIRVSGARVGIGGVRNEYRTGTRRGAGRACKKDVVFDVVFEARAV